MPPTALRSPLGTEGDDIAKSQFTYPRPVMDDIAQLIAKVRVTATWNDSQRVTLDFLIDEICREFEELHDGFDQFRFKSTAKYMHHRVPVHPFKPQGE